MTSISATDFVGDLASANDLMELIESRTAQGELGPGDRLPSVRTMATTLELAPNTVAAAYRRLRDRGIVVGRGRQGTIIAATRSPPLRVSTPLSDRVIDAMSGNPDPALLPALGPALARAGAAPGADYGAPALHPALATAARGWLRADNVPNTNITVVSGAMDAIERVLHSHLRPGDVIGVEDPGHVPVFDAVTTLGLIGTPMVVDEEGVTPDGLERALLARAKAVIITPRAHNPTGAALTASRTEQLNRLLAEHPNVLVIEDDHAGPVAGVPLAALDRSRPAWAFIRSASKSLGPDLRLAILSGDPATVDRVEQRLATGPGWVSHLLQAVVADLLTDPEATDQVGRAAESYRARRLQLIERLADAGIESTGRSGLHVWIPVPAEQPVADALRDAGYAVRVGSAYRRSTPPAVRVTVASLDTDQIDEVASLLIEVLGPDRSRNSRQL